MQVKKNTIKKKFCWTSGTNVSRLLRVDMGITNLIVRAEDPARKLFHFFAKKIVLNSFHFCPSQKPPHKLFYIPSPMHSWKNLISQYWQPPSVCKPEKYEWDGKQKEREKNIFLSHP
jgi:hypothetical protein